MTLGSFVGMATLADALDAAELPDRVALADPGAAIPATEAMLRLGAFGRIAVLGRSSEGATVYVMVEVSVNASTRIRPSPPAPPPPVNPKCVAPPPPPEPPMRGSSVAEPY